MTVHITMQQSRDTTEHSATLVHSHTSWSAQTVTTGRFTPRPLSICLADTCLISNWTVPTVTAVSGHLVESCSLGSSDPPIVWIGECTTVNNSLEREGE